MVRSILCKSERILTLAPNPIPEMYFRNTTALTWPVRVGGRLFTGYLLNVLILELHVCYYLVTKVPF